MRYLIIMLAAIILLTSTVLAHDPNEVVSAESPFYFSANASDPNEIKITMTMIITEDEYRSRKRLGARAYFKQQLAKIIARNMRMYDAWLASMMSIPEKETATGNN